MDVGAVAVRHEAASAVLVRHAVAEDLLAHSIARDSVDDVVLVVSELVGNAVTHGACPGHDDALDVTWEITGSAVVIRVGDRSPDFPQPRDAAPTAVCGRGMAIIAALATDWGVEWAAGGKQVWARVPVVAA